VCKVRHNLFVISCKEMNRIDRKYQDDQEDH